MSSAPIPVALCGATEQIGKGVIAGLKPEYEVIHFALGPEGAKSELPLLLRSLPVPSPLSTLGSGSGSSSGPARAVILGGAFDDEAITNLKSTVSATPPGHESAPPARRVPWLQHDMSKPAPPLGPEYGKAMVRRVKETMEKLEKEGKLDGNDDGVYPY